jgi:hypothetical protein
MEQRIYHGNISPDALADYLVIIVKVSCTICSFSILSKLAISAFNKDKLLDAIGQKL